MITAINQPAFSLKEIEEEYLKWVKTNEQTRKIDWIVNELSIDVFL